MNETIIVAGITRSGLTLTMQMLHAGGAECFGEYPAFEGYELGNLPYDKAKGMAIKAVDTQHQIPPPGDYTVIYLRRNLKQQAKSQNKFFGMLGFPHAKPRLLIKSNKKDYKKIDRWVYAQNRFIEIFFEAIIENPRLIATRINNFVGPELNIDKMVEAVKPRGPECYDGILEAEIIREHQNKLSNIQG